MVRFTKKYSRVYRRQIQLSFMMAVAIHMTCPTLPGAVTGYPNIIVVLADDLGYGDVRCFDPEFAKVPTPCVDRLAEQGMCFSNAHDSASLCSPSRYSLLTGRYSWRSPLREHVVGRYGTPLIPAGRLTLPKMLQQQGYTTACFGKWHLGMDWPMKQKDGSIARAPQGKFVKTREGNGTPAFDEPINDGPIARGFDYYFGVDVPNYPPYTFLENDRMLVAPTEAGTKAPGWKEDRILPTIVERTEKYIGERARDKKPFFIYMSLTSPHEPVAPSQPFRGKSGISPVADFIMETDAALGRVMTALERGGLADNTILVFSSDNGHCGYTGLLPFVKMGHRVGGPYRGYKGNISEGGHRIPLVVRWPKVVQSGSHSRQLVCLSDMMATIADVLRLKLPDQAGEDSVSFLPLLTGKDVPVRKDVVIQCYYANVLTILDGKWKLALCAADGCPRPVCEEKGVPHDMGEGEARQKGLPPIQLYNLDEDPGEMKNLQADHPDIVKRLHDDVLKYIETGRSTPGTPQRNDVQIAVP